MDDEARRLIREARMLRERLDVTLALLIARGRRPSWYRIDLDGRRLACDGGEGALLEVEERGNGGGHDDAC